jgi:ABC-type bacteriocin/lantibiotic exporter with double-glycine peptidase domain
MKIKIKSFKQEANYTCLPSCIRIIMNYFGNEKPENEIATACLTTKAGTRLRDAVKAIRSFGYEVSQIQDGSLDELFRSILGKEPVIVILGAEHLPYGNFGSHATVVIGFAGNKVIFIEPAFGKEMRIDMLEFLKAWQSRGKKGVIIHHQK